MQLVEKKQSCGEACGKARVGAERMTKGTEDEKSNKIRKNARQNNLFFRSRQIFFIPARSSVDLASPSVSDTFSAGGS